MSEILSDIDAANVDIDMSDEDEDFIEVGILLAFPRRAKIIRHRPDHFLLWQDDEFRLSKNTVQYILSLIENKITSPTIRNHAVTASQKLLMTLRYYATGSFIAACGDFAGIHKSTAGKIVKQVSEALAALRPHFIYMPRNIGESRKIRQRFFNIAKFPSCIGAMDCTHIKIQSRGGAEAEIFRNRKQFFSLNVQTICDADLKILNIVCRWPGSCHDSTIFQNSRIRQRFDEGEFGDAVLVADSGYSMRRYVITPMSNPITQAENLFNESQIRTRNPVERSYGVWKRRFPVLSLGMNIQLNTIQAVIVATAVLHNIARELGDDEPIVTDEIENEINLTQFDAVRNPLNEEGNRSIHRRRFFHYFSTLL